MIEAAVISLIVAAGLIHMQVGSLWRRLDRTEQSLRNLADKVETLEARLTVAGRRL